MTIESELASPLNPTTLRDCGTEYFKAIITFVDILGFSSIIRKQTSGCINDILNKLEVFSRFPQKRRKKYSNPDLLPMLFQFSDSIVRVQPVPINVGKCNPFDFLYSEITSNLIMQGNLVCHDVMIRGAMTYGDICVTKNRIFGPAFIKAYELESKVARYPRIIIDENILIENHRNEMLSDDSDNYCESLLDIKEYLKMGNDGTWFIEYLSHLCEAERDDQNIQAKDVLFVHRNSIQKMLDDPDNIKSQEVLSKIRWVANYHNEILDKHFKRLVDQFDTEETPMAINI